MLQKERTTATTANLCSVMESGNHSKNGASLKSLMSKGNWWITACLFLFFSVMGACKDEKDNELPAPTDLTATQVEDGINVSWHYVKGADCYMLQIADEAGNSQQVDVYDCDYVFKPEKDGTYSFVVSARNSKDLGKLSNTVYCAYTAPKKEVTEGSILGSWFCEEEGITIILNADGTYTYKERWYEENGTYVFEDSKLTLRDEDGELSEQYVVKSVTDTTLEMTDLYENDWTFTKGSGEGDDDEEEKYDYKNMVGCWICSGENVSLILNSDSTYTYKENGLTEKGTSLLENSVLTLRNEKGELSEKYTVKSLTETTLKMTDSEGTDWTFEKGTEKDTYDYKDLFGFWGYQDGSTYKTFMFNSDTTYIYKETANKEIKKNKEGRFRFEDLKLTLLNEYGLSSESYTVESVTDTTLKIKNTNSYYGSYMTFKKLEAYELTVPTGLKAVQVAGQKIQVSWDPVEDADRYSLEYTYKYLTTNYYGQSEKEYNKVVEVQSNEYLYSPEYLTGVKSFSFSVRAIHDKPYEETAWSDTVSCDYIIPGGGTKSGLYMGIIGFNDDINVKNISLLDDYINTADTYSFTSFIDMLGMKEATGMYYAVDNAIKQLEIATLPEDLKYVSMITFTDGLDNVSIKLNKEYKTRDAYRDALKNRIADTKIKNLPINAFSIGIKGGNVTDVDAFRAGLKSMASADSNSYEVTDMDEVNATFKKIADNLYKENSNTTIRLRITGGFEEGTKIRFTLDKQGNEDASESKFYIEGTYSLETASLQNVVYNGVKSSSGAIISGEEEGVYVYFSFEGCEMIDAPDSMSWEDILQWEYIPSNEKWQWNDEFGGKKNIETIPERNSAVVLLILDCTTSLDALGTDGFREMKDAATNFIEIVTGKNN